LSSGEYLPGSLQGKISSDSCLKKEQMVVSAIVSTPQVTEESKSDSIVFGQSGCEVRKQLLLHH
ncbi:hypothetical protein, partial [Escherichia coli]|uniref:hypothetical protein n=2 Tax=Escherichia coli TaxID=562 RepID=UPI00197B8EAB